MPTYNYECQGCGHAFEKFQTMSARVMRKCPECKKPKLERLIGSGAGIIFKGSGFYETDYRNQNYSADAKKDQDQSGSKKESKCDGCPANDKTSAVSTSALSAAIRR